MMTSTLAGATTRDDAALSEVPRAVVAQMARSLDFYLALGCEVVRAADGWALLRSGSVSFVLAQAPAPGRDPRPPGLPTHGSPWVRLSTPDSPAGEIVVLDPDRRPVAIARTVSTRRGRTA